MTGGELPTGAVAPASGGSNSGELGWGMGMARGLGALGRGGDPIPRLNSGRGRSEGEARRGAEGGGNGGGAAAVGPRTGASRAALYRLPGSKRVRREATLRLGAAT
jgi:hypothetical protein